MPGILTFSFVTKALSAVLPAWFSLFPFFPVAFPTNASVPKEGWWNFVTAGLPLPAPTTVPADALGVGNDVVQPDKIAAVGITLQAELGSSIQTLRLDLKEATDPLANIGSATVVACPVTGIWEPSLNGSWADLPEYDCSLGKAEGKRSDDGTWSFDLAPFGAQWLDAGYPLPQEGVVLLIESASAPVQVSFRAIKTGEFRLEFAATSPTTSEPSEPVVVGNLEPPAGPAAVPTAPSAPSEPDDEAVLLTKPTQNRREKIGEPNLTGNMPWGVWLLVPIALGAAAAVSYALGPGIRGARARHREGAVSRVLSRGGEEL